MGTKARGLYDIIKGLKDTGKGLEDRSKEFRDRNIKGQEQIAGVTIRKIYLQKQRIRRLKHMFGTGTLRSGNRNRYGTRSKGLK